MKWIDKREKLSGFNIIHTCYRSNGVHTAVRPRAIGDTRRTRRSAHVEPPPYRQIVFCGKAIIQLNLCRERSRFVLSVGFCAPLFRKLMRNGFHYVPYKRYYSNPLRMRCFERKEMNANLFSWLPALERILTWIKLISISISWATVSSIMCTCVTLVKAFGYVHFNFRKIISPCSLWNTL